MTVTTPAAAPNELAGTLTWVPGNATKDVEKDAKGEEDPFDRFTPARKRLMVGIVAFSALLAPFASTSFLPSIPDISEGIHISASTVDYTVCVYLAVLAVGPLVFAPYASYYGRRPVYLLSLPLYSLGSIGVALSDSLVSLILTRILQAFGASSVLSVGAGTIGDLYRPTERGSAMALFYAFVLLGPCTSPVVAGALTEYAKGRWGSWRAMQWLLAGMGAFAVLLTAVFLPETAWTRQCLQDRPSSGKQRFRWVWLDPIRPIWLLRYPNILLMAVNSSLVLSTTYALLVPLTSTLGPRFGITNALVLGTFYLVQGAGNILGSKLIGPWSDRTVNKWIEKRDGERIPEDRLRCALTGSGLILPVSILVTGAMMQYVTGAAGLALSLVFLFVSGVGLMFVLTPVNVRCATLAGFTAADPTTQTYCVDVMQDRSAEVIACTNVRSPKSCTSIPP